MDKKVAAKSGRVKYKWIKFYADASKPLRRGQGTGDLRPPGHDDPPSTVVEAGQQ